MLLDEDAIARRSVQSVAVIARARKGAKGLYLNSRSRGFAIADKKIM